MIDRGIIKWQPFNSCFSGQKIVDDINNYKNKEIFPILSEDQISLIEEKIRDAYTLKILVNVEYFYDGKRKNIQGKITFIDLQEKKICLNSVHIYFKQILKIFY